MTGVTAMPRMARGLIGAVAALLMTAGAAGAQDLGPAGTTGATAELVAAAKKEGVLSFYGTAQQDAYDTIFREFMKDYPQIKVTATRVRTANFLERVLLEYKSRRHQGRRRPCLERSRRAGRSRRHLELYRHRQGPAGALSLPGA